MKSTTFYPPTENGRYTVLWKDGTNEVIKARDDESFYSAFERKFGTASLEAVQEYARGSRLNDFKFDPVKHIWNEIKDSNIVSYVGSMVDALPYQVAV